jgi:hypothetical protein
MEGNKKKGKSETPQQNRNFVAPKNPLLELKDDD